MKKMKCPSCGNPNVEQIDENKYQCPYCGTEFSDKQEEENTEEVSRVTYVNDGGNNISEIIIAIVIVILCIFLPCAC